MNHAHPVPHRLVIDEVRLKVTGEADRVRGLLGYIACRLNGNLVLDGLTLRRTAAGRLAISFPSRRDRLGLDHPIVRPVDDRTRREIEEQIFGALGLAEGLAS